MYVADGKTHLTVPGASKGTLDSGGGSTFGGGSTGTSGPKDAKQMAQEQQAKALSLMKAELESLGVLGVVRWKEFKGHRSTVRACS
jgi:hypothetical protein